MKYQKTQKEKITSNFIGLKILASSLLALSVFFMVILWHVQTTEIAISVLLFGVLGIFI